MKALPQSTSTSTTTTTTTTTTVTTTRTDSLIELYTTVLGRPADSDGLSYWEGSLLELLKTRSESDALKEITSHLSISDEYQLVSSKYDYRHKVKKAYKNAYNYDADEATIEAYVVKLDKGEFTLSDMLLDVISTAKQSPKGKLHLGHKTKFSKYFTKQHPKASHQLMEISIVQFGLITDDVKTLEQAETTTDTLITDITAPVYEKSSVNGDQLVLTYQDDNDLSENTADAASFLVHVNKTVVDVSGVSVDVTAKTITLTLNDAVVTADNVDVSYFAPLVDTSLSNATIQDAAGNDAGFLNQESVTNETVAATTEATTEVVTNAIDGTSEVDTLTGTTGDDVITGNDGADNLTGDMGADVFVINATTTSALLTEVGSVVAIDATTAPSLTTVETITDFASGTDKIQLSAILANTLNGDDNMTYDATTTIGLVTTDFITVLPEGLVADAGNARFYFNKTDKALYLDESGDTVIDAEGAYTAGASDDFAVFQLTGTLVAEDFSFV